MSRKIRPYPFDEYPDKESTWNEILSEYDALKAEIEDWKHTAYTEAEEVVRLNKEIETLKALTKNMEDSKPKEDYPKDQYDIQKALLVEAEQRYLELNKK